MTGVEIMASLARNGVSLHLAPGELRARVKPGARTAAARATIAAHRPELIRALTDEAIITGTLTNLAVESAQVREAWRREVVAWQRWEEGSGAPDPNQRLDLAALRRILPPGACIDCGQPAHSGERHWCACCERRTATHGQAA